MKQNLDDKIIKNAQYRKGLSIAFFNAINNATKIVELEGVGTESLKNRIVFWRDWLLEEHKEYYAKVIANIGINYSVDDAVKKLKSSKTLEELKIVWLSLSEDERRDGEIIKIAKELKKKYETT